MAEVVGWQLGAPHCLSSVQTLQEHVMSCLCMLHQDYSAINKAQQLTHSSFSELQIGSVDSSDLLGMLVQSCGTVKAEVKKSTIEHDWAGIRCISRLQFGKRLMIEHLKRMLMYANLYGDKDRMGGMGTERCLCATGVPAVLCTYQQ